MGLILFYKKDYIQEFGVTSNLEKIDQKGIPSSKFNVTNISGNNLDISYLF